MTLFDTACIFYGMKMHFESNFNFCDYDYKLPETLHKSVSGYAARHRYKLDRFSCFGRQSVIVFGIVNQLRYKAGDDIADMDEKDTKWFYGSLENYVNDFALDVQYLLEHMIKVRNIYMLYVDEKIQWYTMPILFKMLKYDPSELVGDVALIKELKWLYRALYIFKLDVMILKEIIDPLQKKLDLITN
jgi:hypothetical protein